MYNMIFESYIITHQFSLMTTYMSKLLIKTRGQYSLLTMQMACGLETLKLHCHHHHHECKLDLWKFSPEYSVAYSHLLPWDCRRCVSLINPYNRINICCVSGWFVHVFSVNKMNQMHRLWTMLLIRKGQPWRLSCKRSTLPDALCH